MSFIGKVSHYLSLGQEKGIISDEQKKELIALIQSESGTMGFMKILSIIGAVCIGLGIILIIASNWSELPKFIKLLLSLSLPLVSLSIGYYFTYIQRELKILGQAFLLLGGLSIGATIALIGQIYHLDGTIGNLLLMWFFLSLPLVFLFQLKTLSILSTTLFYGTLFYFLTEVWFENTWTNERFVLSVFTVVSGFLAVASYTLGNIFKKKYNFLLIPVSIISLKILFFILFVATLDESMMFLGSGVSFEVIHNIFFLSVVVFVMWWANKTHEILLRHSCFVWIALYMIVKYFDLFSGYLQAGVFFIVTGFFLIGLVYGAIKLNHFLNKKAQNTL